MDRSFLVAMSADEGPSSIGRIADRMGRSPNYAQHYRRRLIKAGIIVAAGRGKLRFIHPVTRRWLRTLDHDPAG